MVIHNYIVPVNFISVLVTEWNLFSGVKCESQCPDGKFGSNCDKTCDCKNNSSCDPDTGVCYCTPGWQGDNCNIPCSEGYYGMGCRQKCPEIAQGMLFIIVNYFAL